MSLGDGLDGDIAAGGKNEQLDRFADLLLCIFRPSGKPGILRDATRQRLRQRHDGGRRSRRLLRGRLVAAGSRLCVGHWPPRSGLTRLIAWLKFIHRHPDRWGGQLAAEHLVERTVRLRARLSTCLIHGPQHHPPVPDCRLVTGFAQFSVNESHADRRVLWRV